MKHHNLLLTCLLSMTILVASANAKTKKAKPADVPPPPPMIEQNFVQNGDEPFKEARAKLIRSIAEDRKELCWNNRSAPVDVSESVIESAINNSQPFFVGLRNEVIGGSGKTGIKSKEQLDEFIKKYDGPEKSAPRNAFLALDPASRLLVLQLRSLVAFKSFFFRAKEYVGTNSITRTMIVSMLRAQSVGIQNFTQMAWGSSNVFSPTPNVLNNNSQIWEAVFNYMTEPMPDMGIKLNSDAAMEYFLADSLNRAMEINKDFKSILDESTKNQKGIWWDNKLFLSIANFADPKDRYIKLGDAELFAIWSGLNMAVSSLEATTSYSLKGLLSSIGNVGQLMGFNIASGQDRHNLVSKNGAEGLTSKNRFKTLEQEKELFTAKGDFKIRMAQAYTSLRESVFYAKHSYDCLMKRTSEDQFIFDVRFGQSMNRIALKSIANLVALFESKSVTSAVIGTETIKMNLWGFYSNPPNSLRELYPTAYNDESNKTLPEDEVTVWDGKKDKLRNYKFESARAWKAAEYQKLFPDINTIENGHTTTEVGKYVRILSQTWGSAAFAIPLSTFIF